MFRPFPVKMIALKMHKSDFFSEHCVKVNTVINVMLIADAIGAFIVFDVTRPQTFDAVSKWKYDLDSKVFLPNNSPIPAVLLANKCDQTKEGLVSVYFHTPIPLSPFHSYDFQWLLFSAHISYLTQPRFFSKICLVPNIFHN